MNILVINTGSSSLKFELFDMTRRQALTSGLVERIGEPHATLHHHWGTGEESASIERKVPSVDHRGALQAVGAVLDESGMLAQGRNLAAIGHRVVHGGEEFKEPTLVDNRVIDTIRRLAPLAPLHNPANILGIEVALETFPDVPQVAVFDTAFHQTLPAHAFRYALPDELYNEHQVRRYGFHGTSHAFVAKRAAEHLRQPLERLNLITLHLGNGASAAAIAAGRSVDTSMGMTPLEGLVMGTRCGDIDPALCFYIGRATGRTPAQVESLLNQQSGLKGLCGANDMREIIARAVSGNEAAQLAVDVYCYRLRKYIGAYLAVLGRTDALIFTAGIGENASAIRQRACDGLQNLGIDVEPARNRSASGEVSEIQSPASKLKVLVIRTDEELEIAEQTLQVITTGTGRGSD